MNQRYRTIAPAELTGLGTPILVSTFMRSGTHLTIDLLRRNFPACRSWKLPLQPLDQLYLPVDVLLPDWEPSDWSARRALAVLRRPRRPILKSHFLEPGFESLEPTQPHVARWLRERARIIYVRRDPRSVLPSLWALLRLWRPQTCPAAPASLDESFLRDAHHRWRTHVDRWQSVPAVLVLRFEEILADPGEAIRKVAEHLGEEPVRRHPILPRPLRSRREARIARLLGTRSPSTSIVLPQRPPEWNPAWDAILHA